MRIITRNEYPNNTVGGICENNTYTYIYSSSAYKTQYRMWILSGDLLIFISGSNYHPLYMLI